MGLWRYCEAGEIFSTFTELMMIIMLHTDEHNDQRDERVTLVIL